KNNDKFIPDILQDFNYYVINMEEGYNDLYRRITGQPKVIKPDVGNLKKLIPKSCGKSLFPPANKPLKIETSKLPVTSPDLYGREAELEILDDAWENPHTKVLSFVAWGGVGKSALVNAWLNTMEEQNYKGAELVYGWSFYSQGTKEKGSASSDGFINDALKWFGYTGETPTSHFEKGRLLAGITSQHKTLLILDGLEPLQYPPGEMHGCLKDQAMTGFLKSLARNMDGLCIITSRCKVEDLKATEGKLSHTRELENLSDEAGMAVLKSYRLKGKDSEFSETSREFKGHALALHLVGSYLNAYHNGDIKQRHFISKLTEEEQHGGHARRVMKSYETWFAEKNQAELDVLYLLGLFDRPALKEAIDILKQEPAIKGLTDRLQNLSNREWQKTLNHLRDLHLIAKKDDHTPYTLDCHPLIREHFGEQLQQQNPEAWKEAHTRLYEYYKNLPKKELPDTLEEMEPLFAAVRHGCLAGKHQESLDDVYWERIRRQKEAYTVKKLGAFGTDLSCLSNFFESLWDKPASNLTESDKAVIFSWTGFRLRALGRRLTEAIEPLKLGLEMYNEQNNYEKAAINSSNLSELYLVLGNIVLAKQYGEQCKNYADRSENIEWKVCARCKIADAFFQAGDTKKAEELFNEAQKLQKDVLTIIPWRHGLCRFRFFDFLLSIGEYINVQEEIKDTEKNERLINIALNQLTIGKALLLMGEYTESEDYLDQAVDGLRKAGTQHNLPWGLLARAALFRHQKEFQKSWTDLDEAKEIAEYGQMRLHLTDYFLEAARVIHAQLEDSSANNELTIIEDGIEQHVSREDMEKKFKEHVDKAGEFIKKTGYHRRDREFDELQGML
ncbi:MAG: ATP-binding protein, partial [Bacteroidales bacterium]|nr:ATP-binding protein [Bacteroidales bacterium]